MADLCAQFEFQLAFVFFQPAPIGIAPMQCWTAVSLLETMQNGLRFLEDVIICETLHLSSNYTKCHLKT